MSLPQAVTRPRRHKATLVLLTDRDAREAAHRIIVARHDADAIRRALERELARYRPRLGDEWNHEARSVWLDASSAALSEYVLRGDRDSIFACDRGRLPFVDDDGRTLSVAELVDRAIDDPRFSWLFRHLEHEKSRNQIAPV